MSGKHLFQKGQSGNPGGRTVLLTPEVKAERKKNLCEVILLVSKHWKMTEEQAQRLMAGPDVTRLEMAISRLIDRATMDGDISAFKILLEIMVGKLPDHEPEALTEEEMLILNRARSILIERRTIVIDRPSDSSSD